MSKRVMGDFQTLDKTATTVVDCSRNYMSVFYKRILPERYNWPLVISIIDPNITKMKTRTQNEMGVCINRWMFPAANTDFLFRGSLNLE